MNDWFNSDGLIASNQYQEAINTVVLPYLQRRESIHSCQTADGTSLYCASYTADSPAGTVLVLHGFTENTFKYSEIIFSLLQNGYSVLAYDQRGHGRSGRPAGISDLSVTHVDRFSYYVDDLSLVSSTILSRMTAPYFVFAHSMGGAVTALYLESHPETFSSAVLCAPMIAPNTGAPAPIAAVLCRGACLLGCGKHRPFFLKSYSGPEDFATSCATDPLRFAWFDRIKAEHPEFQNSVPSYRWSSEAIRVTRRILAPGAPERISCPVLLTAADHDSSVMPVPQEQFIQRVPNGRYMHITDSRHEIFRSVNDVLFPWWHEILSFFHLARSLSADYDSQEEY